jgi:NitT/TauT family transport system permease protein
MTASSTKANNDKRRILRQFWHRHGGTLIALAAVAICLGVWECVAIGLKKEYMLPRFSTTCVAFGNLWKTKSFYTVTGATLLRCIEGFGIAFGLGCVMGVLGGVVPMVRSFFKPIVAFFRAAPTMALTLIILVWLRAKYTPICIGVMMVFPIIYTTVADSIATAPADLLQMARVYRMPMARQIRYIYVPHAVPMICSASSTAFALNIKATVSAEVLALTADSVGSRMSFAAADLLDGSALLFAWLLVAVMLSVAMEGVLKGVQYLLTRRYRYAA